MSLLGDFERAWPHLQPAVDRARQHTKESVYERIALGRARLWLLPNSATVSEILVFPNGRRSFQTWLVGGEYQELLDWGTGIAVDAAKEAKCNEMRFSNGRRGLVRVLSNFDWRETGATAVRDLG